MKRETGVRCLALITAAILMAADLLVAAQISVPGVQNTFTYRNTPVKIEKPLPILADHTDFVEPLRFEIRYLAPPVFKDEGGRLEVRSWRYWYNARGIIEMVNRLDPRATAIVNLMAWGVDDGGGFRTPEPAGVVLAGTSGKNALYSRQIAEIVNPFIRRLSVQVALVGHTLPGLEDPVRKLLYPSISTGRDSLDPPAGKRKLEEIFTARTLRGPAQEESLELDGNAPLTSYFQKTPSSHASVRGNGPGFEEIPVPLANNIFRCPSDIVFYDGEGYEKIRDYLRKKGIRHILVMGFIEKSTILPTHPRAGAESADKTVMDRIGTAPGIERLGKDFNIFIVGDAVRTTFPGSTTPRYAVQAALARLSGEYMITQAGWVKAAGGK